MPFLGLTALAQLCCTVARSSGSIPAAASRSRAANSCDVSRSRSHSGVTNYQDLAAAEKDVTFVERLGTYRYMDMDVTIRAALETLHNWRRLHSL
jgi:UDP-galactopyranose mutase